MRKNKLITLLMAGYIFASTLTGCGNNSEKTNVDKVNEKVFTYGQQRMVQKWGMQD